MIYVAVAAFFALIILESFRCIWDRAFNEGFQMGMDCGDDRVFALRIKVGMACQVEKEGMDGLDAGPFLRIMKEAGIEPVHKVY